MADAQALAPESTPSAEAFFDALDGVVYWTDQEGVIRGGGVRNWTAFARENGAPALQLGSVVGRPLLDFISGEKVRAAYARLYEDVFHQGRTVVSFGYRCDGPLVIRQMRMTVGPVFEDGRVAGLMHQSQLMVSRRKDREAFLPPVDESARPVAVCSFCAKVRQGGRWLTPHRYLEGGGVSGVRLEHTICEACEERVGL